MYTRWPDSIGSEARHLAPHTQGLGLGVRVLEDCRPPPGAAHAGFRMWCLKFGAWGLGLSGGHLWGHWRRTCVDLFLFQKKKRPLAPLIPVSLSPKEKETLPCASPSVASLTTNENENENENKRGGTSRSQLGTVPAVKFFQFAWLTSRK